MEMENVNGSSKPSFAVRYRTRIGAVLGLFVVFSLLFVDNLRITGPWFAVSLLRLAGTLFLIVGAFGRLWCTLYIGGKKNKALQQQGPYSLVRHPLYLFSFMLGLGISALSGSLVVLILVLAYFWWQYRITIRFEEKTLRTLFSAEYEEYSKRVPCFLPRGLKLDSTTPADVNMVAVRKEALHGLFFLMAVPILELVVRLHELGIVPHIRL